MAGDQGRSSEAVAQPLSAVAHRDVLGLARRSDQPAAIPRFSVGASRGTVALSALGGADAASLLTQAGHGVDAGCAARRNQARQGGRDHYQGDGEENHSRIRGGQAGDGGARQPYGG